MALFKIYRGRESDLPTTYHDGYAYFTTDTGELFIDIAASADHSTGTRVQVNAGTAKSVKYAEGLKKIISGTTKTIEIDEVLTTSDVIPVENGGTGGTDAATARTNLEVDSSDEVDDKVKAVTAIAMDITIQPSQWVGSGPYTYTWGFTDLQCGASGSVPPIISPKDSIDVKEWSKVSRAIATKGSGIVFTCDEEKPEVALALTMIDLAQKV